MPTTPPAAPAKSGDSNSPAVIASNNRGTENDINYNASAPHLSSSAAAMNRDISNRQARVQAWNQSGLNGKLSSAIASGNFAQAFATAWQSGSIQAMLDPMNLTTLIKGGKFTQAQFQAYYKAFAPYQNKLKGSALGLEDRSNTVWVGYNENEAINQWAGQQSMNASQLLANPYKDVPNPEDFSKSTDISDLQATAMIVGIGLTVAAPELAPVIGETLGVGTVASGAIAGGVAGGATGYGATGTASGALKGAAFGAAGGALAGGGAKAIADATGLPTGVVSAAGKVAIGAAKGGVAGAESAAIGSLAAAGLQEAGLPAGVASAAGGILGSTAAQDLNDAVTTHGTRQQPPPNIRAQLSSPGANATAGVGSESIGFSGSAETTGAPMANPNNPQAGINSGSSPVTGGGSDTTGVDAGAGGGGDSSWLSDLSTFLSSPAGNLAEFGTLGALGLAEANKQKGTNDQLAGTLAAPGKPFTAAGAGELGQLTGGPSVGGPLGQSITDQTAAAKNLAGVAKTYSTGQLTPAQNLQVSQYVADQKNAAKAELAAAGITDPNSQQYQDRMQQIDNNAAMLGQQLVQGNTNLAEGALTAVQGTYTTLLNQALSSSEFGFSTQLAAVQTQIQSDTALTGQLEQLFAGIAEGFGTAMKGSGKPSTPSFKIPGVSSGASGGGSGGGSGVASNPSGSEGDTTFDPTQDPYGQPFYPGVSQMPSGDQTNAGLPTPYGQTGGEPNWFDPTGGGYGTPAVTQGPGISDFSGDPFGG
jgi:hypothetical protein